MKERVQKKIERKRLQSLQLISVWYRISDVQTEAMVNDSLSAIRFCGLDIEDSVPDHNTFSRFRTELTEKKACDL